jgi:hypothetical protein
MTTLDDTDNPLVKWVNGHFSFEINPPYKEFIKCLLVSVIAIFNIFRTPDHYCLSIISDSRRRRLNGRRFLEQHRWFSHQLIKVDRSLLGLVYTSLFYRINSQLRSPTG